MNVKQRQAAADPQTKKLTCQKSIKIKSIDLLGRLTTRALGRQT